jgi:hypothetical protein
MIRNLVTQEDPLQLAHRVPKLIECIRNDARTEFSVDVERRIVLAQFGKTVTLTDIRRYTEQLRAHPKFDASFSEIIDLREVEDLALKAADFLKLADEIDCFEPGAWRAFVVHNSVQDHAARVHKLLRPKGNTRIFSSPEEAREWIESRPAPGNDKPITN